VEKVLGNPAGYYDLVLMDIQMPEMNGYEATIAIRANESDAQKPLPIVAMSADAFMDDVQHAKEVGMNGHIAKPVEIDKLLRVLDEFIS
jgi:CheY-like chemotaxis protein